MNLIEKYLGEKYSEKTLPKNAVMMKGMKLNNPKYGTSSQAQAYVVNPDGTISVYEKGKKKGWQEWWTMNKSDFAKEFGIKTT